MKKLIHYLNNEIVLIIVLLVVSGIAHGFNMFSFPYYENDEAIYLGRAWSLYREGTVAPYTYWYDHAPLGWIMLAAWYFLTSDIFMFGFSINSGRVFILIVHLISSLLVYLCMKKLTKSRLASALSVIIFSLSPLAIYFQRRVLLDNLMTFWILLSLYFLLNYQNKLRNIILSAVSYACAFLTKETAVFVLPAYIAMLWMIAHKHHRIFVYIKWISFVALIISIYFIYALLKGELFPQGVFDNREHVSLLGTLLFQAGRKGGSILDIYGSNFWFNMRLWFREDPLIMGLGIFSLVANLIIGIRDTSARILALFLLFFMFYLIRGGIVIEFYILPLFPFFAMNIAYLGLKSGEYLKSVYSKVSWIRFAPNAILISLLPIFFFLLSFHMRKGFSLYTSDQTLSQKQAVERILSKHYPDAFYVMDNYGFIDLNERNKENFAQAHHYWKVEYDPEITRDLLHNDPHNIDYFLVSPQLTNDVGSGGFPLVGEALAHSRPIERFWNDGWGVELWATNYPKRILHATWQSYKAEFIHEGQVIDPQSGVTTSEGQAYALLRAVYMDDKKAFDQIYEWTTDNLQQDNNLFVWRLDPQENDRGTATDADTDIATALLFAYRKWGEDSYKKEALNVLDGMWEQLVVVNEDNAYVTAGNWAHQGTFITVNPSYLSPAQYRIFAEADPKHQWLDVADTSYEVLEACTFDLTSGDEKLPPEWCRFNTTTKTASPSTSPQPVGTEYGYNAIRVPMRISWDVLWYNSPEGVDYLRKLTLLGDEWEHKQKLSMVYTHAGEPQEDYESVQAYAGNLGYFLVVSPRKADDIYEQQILAKLYEKGDRAYWEDPGNYYSQNLAWFATAMYGKQLTNLWRE